LINTKMKSEVPVIHIGIFSAPEISFTLSSIFLDKNGEEIAGSWKARFADEEILLESENGKIMTETDILLSPLSADSIFTIKAVTIGVNFHWQRKEDQIFKGSLKFIIESKAVTAVNIISIEDYLVSVISSEMSATSSMELLKAHAVVSRSWLLAQMEKSKSFHIEGGKYESFFRTENEIVRWYDREDHLNFDVCADDHCQRYQGITRASSPIVKQVIAETFGEVLTYEDVVCDSRYYKCCGGVTELFENVWEPVNHPYLQKVIDNPLPPEGFNMQLDEKENARNWIMGNPRAFCNTSDKKVLKEVLNDYDQETNDFYRWVVKYSQTELSELIKVRTGIDFGIVINLVPIERGVSGRIVRLKIEGTKKTMIIGKELEIRKALSKTHLYSSCFTVEKKENNKDTFFVIHGAGWGHGVGLCQIGAAVMGAKGYSYHKILEHYFKDTLLKKIY